MLKEIKLRSFRNLLYPNNKEAKELDELQTKKVIYEGLREFLKTKTYQFNVGSYYFDITPKNLSVKYETPDTRIEVSNKDIHFESTRQTPLRYFVVSEETKDEYPNNQPYISVGGEILQYDNFYMSETYTFALISENPNDAIKNYIELAPGFELTESEFTDKELSIYRKINPNDSLIDVGILLKPNKVKAVYYDNNRKVSIPYEYKPTETYKDYLPSLEQKKIIVSLIYTTIVDFYNEYVK